MLHAFKHADVAYGAVGVDHERARNPTLDAPAVSFRGIAAMVVDESDKARIAARKDRLLAHEIILVHLLVDRTAVVGTPAVYAARLGCGFRNVGYQ